LAGRGCQPVGEGDDEVSQFGRSLDHERPVERGEQRGQPVEPLGSQFDAQPAFGVRIGIRACPWAAWQVTP